MPRTIQHRFTQGELDPKLLGRTDIDQYYGAVETGTNVIAMTQGGFKRRGGLEHIDEMLRITTFIGTPSITITAPNGGTAANANDQSSLTTFTTTTNISTLNPYVVIHYDLGSALTIGVLYLFNFALTSGTSSQFFMQVSTDNVAWTSLGAALTVTTTSKNYSRRVEGAYRYVRLARIGATDLGTAKAVFTDFNVFTQAANSAVRIVDFQFNTDQSYIFAMTDKNVAVYLDGDLQLDIYVENLSSARLSDISWTQSGDTMLLFHEDLQPLVIQRRGADDYWTVDGLSFDNAPFHAFTEVVQTGAALTLGTMTPSATSGTVTLTFSSGTLPAGTANQYFEGNGGLARVLSAVSATVVNAFVEIPFYSTAAIANTDYNYLSGYEAAWSSTRGYPICGTFHNGRLWIGGSKSRPTTAWASKVGLFYDFALGTAFDDEGIEITLDTDQLNRIINIYSGRNLMIFTSGAEFIIPTSLNEPITPSNVSTARQSKVGSQRGLRVQEVEGGVLYVQNGGQSIQEFIFVDTEQAYANNLLSLLSGHLIENPLDISLRRATSADDGALLAVVRADGELTIATIQRSQKIASFTNHTTDGEFLACGADYNDLYFAVTRNNLNYLERMNDDHFLDASVRTTSGLPATVFTGLGHLNGESCRVYADDTELASVTPSGGSATIETAATEFCEIGLWFQPTITDLPVEFPEQKTIIGKLLNIAEVVLRLRNTSSLIVNDKDISFIEFGQQVLNEPPAQFTGIKRIHGFLGWDNTGQVTITQDQVGTMEMLALSKVIIQGK